MTPARTRSLAVRLLVAAPVVAAVLIATAACTAPVAAGNDGASSTAPVVATCGDTSANPKVLGNLADRREKDIAMQLVSSAENSTLNWRQQYKYLEDIRDGRGYTGGLIGFTSGTGDMLQLVMNYTRTEPNNPLAPFVPALKLVNGSESHRGLGPRFENAWLRSATDPRYRIRFDAAQDNLRDSLYFTPAVALARHDGLPVLGQFAYYDAAVVHGPDGLADIRAQARKRARTPAQAGNLTCYLDAFWKARIVVMKRETAHQDVSRITDLEEKFANDGNYALRTPLQWKVYGDSYRIA